MKEERQQSSQIAPHYYILEGIGKFENMKDLRGFLGVSRQAIRQLMQAGVIKRLEKCCQEQQNVEEYEHGNKTKL